MADLHPLIRLRKHRVEEKQKAMAELFRQAELLESRKRILLDDVAREQKITDESGDVDSMVAFAAYAARIHTEIESLNGHLKKLEPRIQRAQEEIREAFSEQKKAEIIQQQREEEEQKQRDKKENSTLDDIGIEVFRKRQGEDEA